MLADGAHDVNVIDAEDVAGGPDGAVRVELTITSSAHRGAVVVVHGRLEGVTAVDLLGAPGTLVVDGAALHLHLEGAGGASMTATGEG